MVSHYGNAPRFIRASLNRAIVHSGYGIAKALAHTRYRLRVDISSDDLARLDALKNSHSILLPNHPTPHDWLSMYLLSTKLAAPFHYMTAHEQFTGAKQFWLPKFGAYSIRRGGWGDTSSVRETLRILQRPQCSLVIFPEGRCTFSSRGVLDFKAGAVKIGFNYLKRFDISQKQDLFLVPVAIRYQYIESIDDKLEEGLDCLERRLVTATTGTLSYRMGNLAQHIVANLEKQYGLGAPGSDVTWRPRIESLCNAILRVSEQSVGIREALRLGIMNRACNIRQVLAIQGHHRQYILGKAAYEEAYYPTLLVLILESIGELDLSKPLSLSRQADLLCSLERIVYKIPDPVPKGRRQAIVRIGESVNLTHWLADYCANRHRVAQRIVTALQASVEHNLSTVGNVDGATARTFNLAKVAGADEKSVDPVPHG